MSDALKAKLKTEEKPEPRVWSLPRSDWKKLESHLLAAQHLFEKAEPVSAEQWDEWTAEFSEGQGFPSIIYHDKPIIIKPLVVDK